MSNAKTDTGWLIAGAVAAAIGSATGAAAAWQPSKPVTFVVPAGTGGGADQMARFIQGVVAKHKLMTQPMVVVNKGGGAGAEGFLEVKGSKPDGHTIIITLSNLFTTPMSTGVPFNWKDMTPVQMLALDQFVLWVNAKAPYKAAGEYIAAVKAGDDKTFKMGGTGSKQEDQIITVALERKTAPKKFTYVPYQGGGAVATQLVGEHVNSTVNNPIEAASQWKAGNLRPLCIFDSQRSVYKDGGHGVGRHPDLQGGWRRRHLPDAARNLHGAGQHPGSGRLLRRSVQEGRRDGRLEGLHEERRLQPEEPDG